MTHREIPRGRRCRPHHQSDDRGRPGPWRHRAGHRQRAAGGDHLRARPATSSPARSPITCRRRRTKFRGSRLHHMETYSDASITKAKGVGEGGAIGAPAAIAQRHQRCAVAVQRLDRRNPGDAAENPRGVARQGDWRSAHDRQGRHHPQHQRRATTPSGRAAAHACRRDPRELRPDRNPYRLRAWRLRRLHGHRRRRSGRAHA